MFIGFFYNLRDAGLSISPTSFLTLHKALKLDLINSLEDFYILSRSILVKSERYFDLFDKIFAHQFKDAVMAEYSIDEFDDIAKALLETWLKNPGTIADALGIDESKLKKYTSEELIEYFKKRLREQTERHDGGGKWIGTGGTSPVGHSGYNPESMRVSGISRNKSAIKVALERRYRNYSLSGPITQSLVGEALKRLRNMVRAGPKDQVDIDATLYQTMRNAGEVEIVFKKSMRDRLKVIIAIDNGGWSMDPYVPIVQTIFDYSRAQFKDLQTFFFHNTIYNTLWSDYTRYKKPHKIDEFFCFDPETRFIVVGDASMSPFELVNTDGSLYVQERSGGSSIECLRSIVKAFPHSVWLNPVPMVKWKYTETINIIRDIFPMFELSIDGLEKAVTYLKSK
ncbi:MAG: hypothetical protein PVI26_06825 [Chitinispirillia bacterium]|jgi:uncharacterized protein with von Willebrand factor type A (vWA) domain